MPPTIISQLAIPALLLFIGLSNGAVPTGCVKLKSYQNNLHLDLMPFSTMLTQMTTGGSSWTGVKVDGDYYRFLRSSAQSLQAVEFTADDERRMVQVRPGGETLEESLWAVQELANGRYLLRNKRWNEYLYSEGQQEPCNVYSWQGAGSPSEDGKFQWDIKAC